jgi:hypothetical protein
MSPLAFRGRYKGTYLYIDYGILSDFEHRIRLIQNPVSLQPRKNMTEAVSEQIFAHKVVN